MTALSKNTDKVLINSEVDVPIAFKQKEVGNLLVPQVVNAGATVVDGRLCVTLYPWYWDRGMAAGVSCQSRSNTSAAARWRGSRRDRPTGGVTVSPSSESDRMTITQTIRPNSSGCSKRGGSDAQEGPGCGSKVGKVCTPDGP